MNAPISIIDGEYKINSGSWTSASGVINNGDSLKVRRLSSTNYSTPVDTTVTVGTYSTNFVITTKDPEEETLYLQIFTEDVGGGTGAIKVRLINGDGSPVSVFSDISFRWTVMKTAISTGDESVDTDVDVLPAGLTQVEVDSFTIADDAITPISVTEITPDIVDGHPIEQY